MQFFHIDCLGLAIATTYRAQASADSGAITTDGQDRIEGYSPERSAPGERSEPLSVIPILQTAALDVPQRGFHSIATANNAGNSTNSGDSVSKPMSVDDLVQC